MRRMVFVLAVVAALVLVLATSGTALASPWTNTRNVCDPNGPSTSGYEALNTFIMKTRCFADGTGPVK